MALARSVRQTDHSDRQHSFAVSYAAHYEDIFAYALRRTDTADDAADIVAETFLTAWRRFEQAPEPGQIRLWLYGIARRVLANHIRGRRRRDRLGARLWGEAVNHSTNGIVTLAESRGAIAAALGRLADRDRDILLLVGAEGLRPSEAAQVLGCSTSTARVRLHRARTRFARELAAEGIPL